MNRKNTTFYKCEICGNIIGLIDGNIDHMTCCGKKMENLTANSVDAAFEKHVPVYKKIDDEIVVKVGEVAHPMEKEHYIMWVAMMTENQTTRMRLEPEQEPVVRFKYIPNSILYAYCNKHGLWMTEVE